MRVVSLFTGIAGFDLAFERAGMNVVAQVEIDPKCGELLTARYPDVPLFTDIQEVKASDLPDDIDLICGGFPCQDISTAGRRAGLAGERSGLWWEFHRLLEEVRPEWCVIENVAGLLSSGGRRDLGAILGALGDLGYGFAYRVLDAQWFGVAQRRRRVFIVGHLGDRRAAAVLLEPEGSGGDSAPSREAGEVVAGTLEALTRAGGFPGTDGACANHVVADHLVPQTFDWQVAGSERTWIHDQPGGPARSITAHKTLAVHTVGLGSDPIVAANLAQPVTGRNGDPGVVQAEQRVRRLTPTECERLQGFPDGWTEGFSDAQRYRMLGNAVAVPVVEWIGRRLMAEVGR